jgi:hypothetical protein
MIRKSMPSGHDPMGGDRFSLGTNAKRLPGDHAQIKEIERDDDSKKSHPALAIPPTCHCTPGSFEIPVRSFVRATHLEAADRLAVTEARQSQIALLNAVRKNHSASFSA